MAELSPVEQYLAERRSGVGSSDVAAILGLSPYRSVVDVWREKVGLDGDEHAADSPAMRRGRFLEDAILRRYMAEEGLTEVRTGRVVVEGWRRAQLDGVTDELVIECKSVMAHVYQRGDWGQPGTDEIPEVYLCQVLWQLDLAGLEVAHVPVVVVPEQPDRIIGASAEEVVDECALHIYVVRRSQPVVESIVADCRHFWEGHVLTREPPEPRTYEEARALWWETRKGASVAATPEVEDALARLTFAKALDKLRGEIEERAKLDIARVVRDAETLLGPDGEEWLRQKTQRRKAYTVAETETKPVRLLKAWHATPLAQQVKAAMSDVRSMVRPFLTSPTVTGGPDHG